jgi:paired amphipathic helix protein Sin3a
MPKNRISVEGNLSSRRTHDDAVEFLDRVREMFSDLPYIYNSFLEVMKGFKDQTITTDDVINRVKLLFKGHPDLLQGFNLFLPPAYRIQVEAESPPTTAHANIEDQKAQQFARAYKYVTKVKKRFTDAPHTYQEFLTVLDKYQTVHRSVDLVNTEITRLFRCHPDLLSEFAVFLPEHSHG